MDFSLDTSEKIVSIAAGFIAIVSFMFLRKRPAKVGALAESNEQEVSNANTNTNTNSFTVNVNSPHDQVSHFSTPETASVQDIPAMKRSVRILFVDDDRGFKIVGILKKMGWEHTKIVIDINSLEQVSLVEADVVFVDIQGVGKAMHYTDEGLGLALAIKRRYPNKKIIIYSAQEEGGRFHEALQEADYSLPKTAEPIRFEDTIVRVLKNG